MEMDKPAAVPGPSAEPAPPAAVSCNGNGVHRHAEGKKNAKKRHSFTALSMTQRSAQVMGNNRHSMEISAPVLISSSDPRAAARIADCPHLSSSTPATQVQPYSPVRVTPKYEETPQMLGFISSAVIVFLLIIRDSSVAANAGASVPPPRASSTTGELLAAAKVQLPLNIYLAMYAYKPQKADELELRKGEMYRVMEKCQDGWFKGTSLRTGGSGVFPGNYVTPVSRIATEVLRDSFQKYNFYETFLLLIAVKAQANRTALSESATERMRFLRVPDPYLQLKSAPFAVGQTRSCLSGAAQAKAPGSPSSAGPSSPVLMASASASRSGTPLTSPSSPQLQPAAVHLKNCLRLSSQQTVNQARSAMQLGKTVSETHHHTLKTLMNMRSVRWRRISALKELVKAFSSSDKTSGVMKASPPALAVIVGLRLRHFLNSEERREARAAAQKHGTETTSVTCIECELVCVDDVCVNAALLLSVHSPPASSSSPERPTAAVTPLRPQASPSRSPARPLSMAAGPQSHPASVRPLMPLSSAAAAITPPNVSAAHLNGAELQPSSPAHAHAGLHKLDDKKVEKVLVVFGDDCSRRSSSLAQERVEIQLLLRTRVDSQTPPSVCFKEKKSSGLLKLLSGAAAKKKSRSPPSVSPTHEPSSSSSVQGAMAPELRSAGGHGRAGSCPIESEMQGAMGMEPLHRKSGSLDLNFSVSPPTRQPCSSSPLAVRPEPKPLSRERYRVVVPYPPQSEAEIELKEGDIVFVHKKREDGWYKGTLQRTGRTGLFPGSFVESF
ncbi:E3 ubiquitin-protein ligase SH3RF3 [Labeo rohita]|uniref:RING-type E3 ubiquitin transferase n=1 Tax=Labeo rohita TaxID=84645 RepID=A0ABQ8MDM8_LABRO|nr:E3 ubiquitin-protein ligase SH3RF3 [Labeo rohita]